MATWTTITDAALEPGKPIRSVDGLALRDNVTALAEGAAGAPRIENAAMDTDSVDNANVVDATLGSEKFQTGTDERDWVLGRTSGAAAGAVGTYAFAQADSGTTSGFGDSISGSRLTPSSVEANSSGSLSGTWRCMGIAYGGTDAGRVTIWLRIS
jgi:hypothetical protein